MTPLTPPLVGHMFGTLAAHLAQSITMWAWVQIYVTTLGMFVMILPAFTVVVLVHQIQFYVEEIKSSNRSCTSLIAHTGPKEFNRFSDN